MADKYIWATNRAPVKGACQYYRIEVPLIWLEKLGYMKSYMDVGQGGEDDLAAMFTADINLFYSTIGRSTLHQVETINAMKPGRIQDGSLHYPPTTIWDCDDNSDFVHPFNQSFGASGVRHYPSGEFLEAGETLEWEDAKGEKRPLWIDGVTKSGNITFDIQRNINEMKIRHDIIRSSVGVTVASPALASYIKNVIGQPNVYVFPNTVVPSDYEEFPLVRDDKEVRILWQGGQSHLVDWYPLRDALGEITKKYPQVKWVIYGEKYDWILDFIPENRIEYHGWTPYPGFKLKRGLLRADINLCPLADNPFNWCKSAIKWYEGSIWSRPEATLAADVAPYREIKDGETGLLYKNPEEFTQKLSALIESPELRATLGHGAHKWVLNHRTPEKTIPGLFDFYMECRARTTGGKIIKPTTADLRKVRRASEHHAHQR